MPKMLIVNDDGSEVCSMQMLPLTSDVLNVKRTIYSALWNQRAFVPKQEQIQGHTFEHYFNSNIVRAQMIARDTGLLADGWQITDLDEYVQAETRYSTVGEHGCKFAITFDRLPLSMLMITLDNLNELIKARNGTMYVTFSLRTQGKRNTLVLNTVHDANAQTGGMMLQGFKSARAKTILSNASGKADKLLEIAIAIDYDNRISAITEEEE